MNLQNRFLNSPELLLFVATFAFRLVILTSFASSPYFLPGSDDMKFYADWGLRIAGGHLTDGQAFYGLPGYAYLLGAFFFILGFDPFSVALVQITLDSLVGVLIFRIAKEAFCGTYAKGAGIGILAAIGWALFQPAQCFSIILMPTIWLVLAYWMVVWKSINTEKSTLTRPWIAIAVLVGITSTLVATILFSLVLLLAAIALTVRRDERPARRVRGSVAAGALMLGAVLVGMAPAWMHNYLVANEPVLLSAHSGINFWIGNHPHANGYAKIPTGLRASQDGLLKDSISLARIESGRPLKRYEVSHHWSKKARSYISENPGDWLRLLGHKVNNFWNAFRYDDLAILKLLRDQRVLPPGLNFGVIAAFALPGIFLSGQRSPKANWIIGAILLHLLALLPVFVTERYRLAAAPGLLLLGAAGLWFFWEDLLLKQSRKVALYLTLLTAASWYVSRPQPDVGLWSLDYYKAGIRATELKQYDRALMNLQTAQAYTPESAQVIFGLGNVWLGKGDRERAMLHYERALRLNPQLEGALNNMGVLAMEDGQYGLAERCFTDALKMEPENAKFLYLLARTRFASGDLNGAREPLARALALRPAQREFLDLAAKLPTHP